MGLGEKLKDIYYLGEEKWYNFWDKVDEHLPAYAVIDKIDSVIPSFALFLILVFVLLLITGIILMGAIAPSNAVLKLVIIDSSENPVEGAKVTIEGVEGIFLSDEFGLIEDITVPFNQTIIVTAKKGKREKTEPIQIDKIEKRYNLVIGSASFMSSKTIIFKVEGTNETAQGEIHIEYECSTRDSAVTPEGKTIYNGTETVQYAEEECGVLTATITSPKYEDKTATLAQPTTVVNLKSKEPLAMTKAVITLKYNGEPITENVTVQALKASATAIAIATAQTVNGQANFELPEGDYKFRNVMEKGYKVGETGTVTLTKGTTAQATISLQKNLLGYINVTTKEGASNLSGVRVALSKKNATGNLIEKIAKDTNETGQAMIELTEEGPYYLTATKDNYCDKVQTDLNVGANITILMVKENGQCGQKMRVRVIDQDNKPVAYAKTALFGEKDGEEYKLSYPERLTDYNGYAEWNPVRNSQAGEKYKLFGFKAIYSGWSETKEFNARTAAEGYTIKLQVPIGTVKVTVKNNDNEPIQFAEVQLFDEYSGNAITGKKLIQELDGSIEFKTKADKKVYAVIKKLDEDNLPEYESYTTLPKQVIGEGTIYFDVKLSKPPVEKLKVNFLGFYKNEAQAIKVEAGQEYDAIFEVIAPKDYEELGFYMRAGKDNLTKTELDHIFIKQVTTSGKKSIITGSTYNKPKGYNTDSQYTNLEESKWAEAIWSKGTYTPGKIIVGVKVKIRQTAQQDEMLEIGYRAWGIEEGYERDPVDTELGTAQNSATKQELYALTKPGYITVGTETLCDIVDSEKNFCVTTTYTDLTDPRLIVNSFDGAFDAKNNTPYGLTIKVMNNSQIGFDNAITSIENTEENVMINSYSLLTPQNAAIENSSLNAYKTGLIQTPNYERKTTIDFTQVKVTPNKTGTGSLLLRISADRSNVFSKTFTLNIGSDKKMKVKYMQGTSFADDVPKLVSGKPETLTVKAYDTITNIEIEEATAKIYDRFGTELTKKETNKTGLATLNIPASFPGEKLKLKIEKPGYETYEKEITIAEDVVEVTPKDLSFTVNPQTKPSDTKTVKIQNKTGLDLEIKEIRLVGKLKGVLNETQIESWFNNYVGKIIASQDYEEIDFKVISATVVPQAEDLEAEFEIIVGAETKEWITTIPAKIRVGLGKDVDNPSCLQISQTNWQASTQGGTVETSLELKNNCVVDSKPVSLKSIGAILSSEQNTFGSMTAQTGTVMVELGTAYSRVFRTRLGAGEKIPITIKYTPYGGATGTQTGSIIFEALNQTDSKSQKITAEMTYNIVVENVKDCIVIGADLIQIEEQGTGNFSITNNCTEKATISLDATDLQGALSEKDFDVAKGESKEITITSQEGQIAGAYNILVSGRKGIEQIQPLGNIKVIIQSENSCFKLTKYIYDVYDSTESEFDGMDRGYLRNECVQKTVPAQVTGTIPYDMENILKMFLWGALIGGITGGLSADYTKQETGETLSQWNDREKTEFTTRIAEDCGTMIKELQAKQTEAEKIINNKIKEIEFSEEGIEVMKNTWTSARGCKEPEATKYLTCLKAQETELANKRTELQTQLSKVKEIGTTKEQAILKECTASQKKVKDKAQEYSDKINKGEVLVTGKTQEQVYKEAQNQIANELEKNQIKTKDEGLKEMDGIIQKAGEIKAEPEEDCTEEQKACKEAYAKQPGTTSGTAGVGGADSSVQSQLESQCTQASYGYGHTVEDNATIDCGVDKEIYVAKVPTSEGEVKKYCCVPTFKYAKEKKKEECFKMDGAVALVYSQVGCAETDASNITIKEGISLEPRKILIPILDGVPNSYFACCKKAIEEAEAVRGGEESADEGKDVVFELKKRCFDAASGNVFAIGEGCNGNDQSSSLLEYSDGHKDLSYRNPIVLHELWSDESYYCCTPFVSSPASPASPSAPAPAAPAPAPAGTEGTVNNLSSTEFENAFNNSTEIQEYPGVIEGPITANAGSYSFKIKYTDSKSIYEETWIAVDEKKAIWKRESTATIPGYYFYDASKDEFTRLADYTPTGQFLLASGTGAGMVAEAPNSFGGENLLMSGIMSGAIGASTGSWLWGGVAGGLTSAFWEWMNAQDREIDYYDTFAVPLVEITGIGFESPDGISMAEGEKNYDYDTYTGQNTQAPTITNTGSGANAETGNNTGTGTNAGANYMGSVLYNPQAMTATMGQVEQRELIFSNPSQIKQKNKYQPFVGMLTITGEEKVYEDQYKYDYIIEQAKAREEYKENDDSWFKDLLRPPNTGKTETAQMAAEDLKVKETKAYEKKFHLLFESFDYVNEYQPIVRGSCEVGGKKGLTGEEGVPRIKLAWNWDDIAIQECDSEYNEQYNYCDSTQLTIETLKKLLKLREFFKQHPTLDCPSTNDLLGTKTKKLSETSLDTGITLVTTKATPTSVKIEATVQSNNNQSMTAGLNFKFTKTDGTEIQNVCTVDKQTFTNEAKFVCEADLTKLGQGQFNVDTTLSELTLCNNCENNDPSNDTIQTTIAVGASGAQACRDYDTRIDYFRMVLNANNLLDSDKELLEYLSFKTNLVRDGISTDFKEDMYNYLNEFIATSDELKQSGLLELLNSSKFKVTWDNAPGAWNAGKYDAKIIIKFKDKSWYWDNNNIESITLDLAYQGLPEPEFTIYNVGFDGKVGLNSEDGRQGYGTNFEQLTEDVMIISNQNGENIYATKNSASNALTTVNMSVLTGNKAFETLNNNATRGNVLSIAGEGTIEFTLTPSVAVPLVLTINSGTNIDAFAFYNARVNGQVKETGPTFIQWQGIGQNCVDFLGKSMMSYNQQYDSKASVLMQGYEGYGFAWPMVDHPGQVSFYGAFFAPQNSATDIVMTGQAASAEFESTFGNGPIVTVNTAGDTIKALQDVFTLVREEKVCVLGGDYYWNNTGITTDLKSNIDSKETSCIQAD